MRIAYFLSKVTKNNRNIFVPVFNPEKRPYWPEGREDLATLGSQQKKVGNHDLDLERMKE
jgi:hypothetical protein